MSGWRDFPEVTHVVGRAQIDRYAELSGDYNPLHMDPDFAAASQFGTVIAHGPIGLQTVFDAIARWLGVDGPRPACASTSSSAAPSASATR
jgi:3-hydroxybutyryl-CoA dehydratase